MLCIRVGYYFYAFRSWSDQQSAALNSRCRSIQYKSTTEELLSFSVTFKSDMVAATRHPPPPPPEMLPINLILLSHHHPWPLAASSCLPGDVADMFHPIIATSILASHTKKLQYCNHPPHYFVFSSWWQFKTFSRCQQRDSQAISHAFCWGVLTGVCVWLLQQ